MTDYWLTDEDLVSDDQPPSTLRSERLAEVLAALSSDPRMDVVVQELHEAVVQRDASRVFRAAVI